MALFSFVINLINWSLFQFYHLIKSLLRSSKFVSLVAAYAFKISAYLAVRPLVFLFKIIYRVVYILTIPFGWVYILISVPVIHTYEVFNHAVTRPIFYMCAKMGVKDITIDQIEFFVRTIYQFLSVAVVLGILVGTIAGMILALTSYLLTPSKQLIASKPSLLENPPNSAGKKSFWFKTSDNIDAYVTLDPHLGAEVAFADSEIDANHPSLGSTYYRSIEGTTLAELEYDKFIDE